MKTMFALIILCFLVTACSSSYVVTSTSSSDESSVLEFNEFAEGKEAEIILRDYVVNTATNVYLSADSLYWFNPETKLKTSVVKSEIREVMFTDMWLGGLEGAGIGFLSGGVPGLLFGATTAGLVEVEEGGWIVAWSLIGGVGGALIGFPIGLIIGHTNEYEFENSQQIENNNK
ncbi:MAG: hypothetical protein Q7S39_04725 [Ignavibacteria bacterium]|nr:hypothetical protein [Ignavibacteria bacterium]